MSDKERQKICRQRRKEYFNNLEREVETLREKVKRLEAKIKTLEISGSVTTKVEDK